MSLFQSVMVKGFKDGKGIFHPLGSNKSVARPDNAKKAQGVRLRRDFKNPMIQSLIFPRSDFSESQAKEWAKSHGYKAPKTDITKNSIRIRQFPPSKIKSGDSCRTIPLGSEVKAVLCDVK